MTFDRAGEVIWLLGGMVLVGSALIARRHMPRGRMLMMALVWVVIFAILFAVAHRMDRKGEAPLRPGDALNFT
jgi:crotonobetainyl-CoA:carnitine CoA-transferase CaiB-like acyl-CoA transferase